MHAVPDLGHEHVDRLRSLETALDADRMREALDPLARARFGADAAVRGVEIEVFRRHYNRYVVRYRMSIEGVPAGWSLIAKVLEGDKGDRLHDTMHGLWAAGFARDAADGVAIAEPIACWPHLSMQIQEEVGGSPLRDLIRQEPDPAHFRLAARALAKLHRSEVARGPARTVGDYLERCHPRHPALIERCPELESPIARLVEGAYRVEQSLGPVPTATVHGDFHLGQVHVGSDRAWIVDLDAVGRADPASDLGNLLVFLDDKTRRHPHVVNLMAAFLDEYFRHMERSIEERVPLHRALTHLRRACKTLRLGKPGWQGRARRMVLAGAVSIERMEGGRA
jgi:hypothetical protein